MGGVAFSLEFSSMEPKRRALRPIASHARHGDARRLPVNPDEKLYQTVVICKKSVQFPSDGYVDCLRVQVTGARPDWTTKRVMHPGFCSVRRSSFIWGDCSVTRARNPEFRTTRFRRYQ
jgi:hypothetical protein